MMAAPPGSFIVISVQKDGYTRQTRLVWPGRGQILLLFVEELRRRHPSPVYIYQFLLNFRGSKPYSFVRGGVSSSI